MAVPGVLSHPEGGFSFENCRRNINLVERGYSAPKTTKTGTTIVGIIYKDGVILGADTRATSGSIVADKNCSKIHYIAPNMYCCGAGTAADTEKTTSMLSSQMELHALNTGRIVPVVAALRSIKQHLFRYQGYVGAALILGGVDNNGPTLNTIHPHGSSEKLPYATMGSGCLAAMSVLESRYKFNMSLEEGKQLVRDAIAAGIFNDLGSGSYVDICVIMKDKVDYIRPYDRTNEKGQRQGDYKFKPGSTAVISKKVIPIEVESTTIRRTSDDSMDTS